MFEIRSKVKLNKAGLDVYPELLNIVGVVIGTFDSGSSTMMIVEFPEEKCEQNIIDIMDIFECPELNYPRGFPIWEKQLCEVGLRNKKLKLI